MKKTEKNKKSKKRKKAYILAMIFCGLAFAFSLGMYIHTSLQYKDSQAASDEALAIAGLAAPAESSVVIDTAAARADAIAEAQDYEENVADVVEAGTRRLQSLMGSPQAQALTQLDLDALKEVNPDVIGWISIPDTLVSYPLVKGEDNKYYLNHTWNRKSNGAGAIFLECQCSPDFSDFNTLIYGHRMSNTTMFGALASYKKQSFWNEHRNVYICLEGVIRKYTVFASYEPKITDCTYWVNYSQENHKQQVIDFALESSVIDSGFTPLVSDSIITLSTCTGNGHATRWVVQAVLVGEMKTAEDSGSLQPENN